MSDDVRRIVRSEETVVAGDPMPTVVTETTAQVNPAVITPGGNVVAPGVPATVQRVQQTTMPVQGDHVVAHNVAVSDVNPVADRAANMGWLNSLVWFIVGLILAVLAIRFILALTGANPDAGFANLIYGVSSPFRAPFAGLFGKPITYAGAVTQGAVEFETLVAMLVYALIGWGITKLLSLMLGTGRNKTTVYTDTTRRTDL